MPIRIIAIGKKHEDWIIEGIQRYEKRLKQPFKTEWVLLPHSAREGLSARQEESERIKHKLHDSDYVILLDEIGKNVSSPELSALISAQINTSRPITIIIGGAYGVDDSIHQRANFVWSLSRLVFPHQLVRLVLVEQLYRAQEISLGNPYHHE